MATHATTTCNLHTKSEHVWAEPDVQKKSAEADSDRNMGRQLLRPGTAIAAALHHHEEPASAESASDAQIDDLPDPALWKQQEGNGPHVAIEGGAPSPPAQAG